MSEGLFREEALRHHAGGRALGEVLQIPPGWARGTFWFLVLIFAASIAFLYFGRTDVHARGIAVVSDDAIAVYFPERDRPRLRAGARLRLVDPSEPGRSFEATLAEIDPEPRAGASIGARWPAGPVPSRVVACAATVSSLPAAGEVLDAEAIVGRERLVTLLRPGR